jgi:hypothetical protein
MPTKYIFPENFIYCTLFLIYVFFRYHVTLIDNYTLKMKFLRNFLKNHLDNQLTQNSGTCLILTVFQLVLEIFPDKPKLRIIYIFYMSTILVNNT